MTFPLRHVRSLLQRAHCGSDRQAVDSCLVCLLCWFAGGLDPTVTVAAVSKWRASEPRRPFAGLGVAWSPASAPQRVLSGSCAHPARGSSSPGSQHGSRTRMCDLNTNMSSITLGMLFAVTSQLLHQPRSQPGDVVQLLINSYPHEACLTALVLRQCCWQAAVPCAKPRMAQLGIIVSSCGTKHRRFNWSGACKVAGRWRASAGAPPGRAAGVATLLAGSKPRSHKKEK